MGTLMNMAIEADFKQALSCWASGVSVVTAESAGQKYGVTVSSFSSLSLKPPLILFCLNDNSQMLPLIDEAKGFAVNILSTAQGDVSGHFATPGREPGPHFGEIEIEGDVGPHPVLAGVSAHLQCELHNKLAEGDHTIIVGKVVAAAGNPEAAPLVYFQRGYRELIR